MIIDVHSHLFTLRTVLTREAIRVITQRLTDRGFPGFIVSAMEGLLDDLLDRPRYLDERELLGLLFVKLLGNDDFNALLDERLAGLPLTITLREGDPRDLPIGVLRRALDTVSTVVDDGASVGKSVFDIVETLRISMHSTITEVADEILDQMDRDDAVVALMMDIHGPGEPQRDRDNFRRQIDGHREAALQRPGRVLPFFGLHPERPDHFELLQSAIETQGFVGVKLYPSLGYRIDQEELLRVYRYCAEKDVPVLLHCGHGGFYRKREYIDYCDPTPWTDVLVDDLEGLRVCFAHFGGWQSLGKPDGLDEGSWGHTILELIESRPNVFTDLAYHTDQMVDRDLEAHYFGRLAELLEDPKLQRRILYGTDSWLLRMDLTNAVYRAYYEAKMGPGDFDKIARLAPMEFLGFPGTDGGAMRANLARYVAFMDANRERLGAEPASWLADELSGPATVERSPAGWSVRKDAPARTWQGLSDMMSNAQKHKGFLAARHLRLRELSYFRPRDPNFGHLAQQRALVFAQFAGQGAPYRAAYDDTSAVELFTEAFRKGERTLGEVAVLLDSVFHYDRALA